jgi:hypothetical protein
MEQPEKNGVTSYINKDDDPISGLHLRLRYMVEDFDELINPEHTNGQSTTAVMERAVKIAS